MVEGKYVSYFRVITAKQVASGLGLEAQRKAIADHINGARGTNCAEFFEIESGRQEVRPQLERAIVACRVHGARLLIACLDRLSRDVHFLTRLQISGVQFTAVDLPEANELVMYSMASVAQAEAKATSNKTKLGLAAARARGKALGGRRENGHVFTAENRAQALAIRRANAMARAEQLAPIFTELRNAGYDSLDSLARELSARGIQVEKGNRTTWTRVQVARVLGRLPRR